jgi:hypothetical protein
MQNSCCNCWREYSKSLCISNIVYCLSTNQGIDHPDIEIVCIAGLPSGIMEVIQRGGRAVRQIIAHGLCVLFHEKWVSDISLSDYGLSSNATIDSIDFHTDLDRPRKLTLTQYSPPQDRAPLACVLLTKQMGCKRLLLSCVLRGAADSCAFFFFYCHVTFKSSHVQKIFTIQPMIIVLPIAVTSMTTVLISMCFYQANCIIRSCKWMSTNL